MFQNVFKIVFTLKTFQLFNLNKKGINLFELLFDFAYKKIIFLAEIWLFGISEKTFQLHFAFDKMSTFSSSAFESTLLLSNILTSPFLFNFPGMLLFPDIYFHAIFLNCLIWFLSFSSFFLKIHIPASVRLFKIYINGESLS